MTDGVDVPPDADLCRFVPWDLWDWDQNVPMSSAFRASDRQLSVWQPHIVESAGDDIGELCLGNLVGSGHVLLTAQEFVELARGAPSEVAVPKVVWRPNHVHPLWTKWAAAHAQVETDSGDKGFARTYRLLLAQTCRIAKKPEGESPGA